MRPLATLRDLWIRRALATGPVDRPRLEAAVDAV
jgi:hypothetical protein